MSVRHLLPDCFHGDVSRGRAGAERLGAGSRQPALQAGSRLPLPGLRLPVMRVGITGRLGKIK